MSIKEADLLATAREAAAAGAAIVQQHNRHVSGERIAFDLKTNVFDLVTEVDRASERAIVEVLSRTGIAIIGEEGGLQGGVPSGAIWYVDPLDGTTNFTHGHPFHCVSVGLVVDGVPRIGVVVAPMLQVLWSGAASLGAKRHDLVRGTERPLRVSAIDSMERALLATGFPPDRRTNPDDNTAAHAALLRQTQGVMRCGSAALDLSLVAEGTYEAFWERKIKAWDLAAGVALLLSAGGKATDPWGRPLVLTEGAVLGSNGILHDTLVEQLAPHLPEAPAR